MEHPCKNRKRAVKDSLGVAIGKSKTHMAHRESWWLCEEVQSKVTVKQARFRELLSCWEGNQEKHIRAQESAKMPEDWRLSGIIPIFQNTGDAQVCNNYRGIKLLSHTMKLWERVIERRMQRETMVSENQFGFMPGRSLIKAIHLIRSLIEKYTENQRDRHLAFIDLEKAYDSVCETQTVKLQLGEYDSFGSRRHEEKGLDQNFMVQRKE
ncbi:retrovirus-related pol polyprotein LINE-1 [Tanacetum coccineum]